MISVINRKIWKLADKYFENADVIFNNDFYTIENKGTCISFRIEKYKDFFTAYTGDLNKCKFSGTETLERLELLLKACKCNIKTIYLEDQSYINYDGMHLDFASLHILAKGQSWYNSLGYKQENYNQECENWNLIRNEYFLDLDFNQLTYISTKNYFDNPFDMLSELNGYENPDTNFEELVKIAVEIIKTECVDVVNEQIYVAAGLIYLNIKNKKYDDNILYYYLYIYICSFFLTYTRHPLIKKINY